MTLTTRSLMLCAACLLPAASVLAQDHVDRELDESLRRTYDGDPSAEPVPDYAEHEIEKERDEFQITLRLFGTAQAANLGGLEIVGREGSSGGRVIELQDDGIRDYDFDSTLAALPTIEFNLGGYLILRGAATAVRWHEDQNQVAAGDSFTFGSTTFSAGQTMESEFSLFMGDIQIGGHAVNNRYVRLGLFGGARYLVWETKLERTAGGAYALEEDKVEALVPTFTLTLDITPTPWLELYVNGTAGWFGYEDEDEITVLVNGTPERIPEKEREMTTLEAEAGLRLVFGGHFGIYVGYRFSYLEIHREVAEREEGARALVHGPVAGILVQF